MGRGARRIDNTITPSLRCFQSLSLSFSLFSSFCSGSHLFTHGLHSHRRQVEDASLTAPVSISPSIALWAPLDIPLLVSRDLKQRNPLFDHLFFNLLVSLPSASGSPSVSGVGSGYSVSGEAEGAALSVLSQSGARWLAHKLSRGRTDKQREKDTEKAGDGDRETVLSAYTAEPNLSQAALGASPGVRLHFPSCCLAVPSLSVCVPVRFSLCVSCFLVASWLFLLSFFPSFPD